jgi:hypothetical protein
VPIFASQAFCLRDAQTGELECGVEEVRLWELPDFALGRVASSTRSAIRYHRWLFEPGKDSPNACTPGVRVLRRVP